MKKIVALIPARGGSKGIPRKNSREFLGVPLVAHSILAAKGVMAVGDVYVSTDDAQIAQIATEHRAKVIDRPLALAMDGSSTYQVVEHAFSVLTDIEVMVLLQPTSPLRTAQQIDEAIALLDDGIDSVVSVCPAHRYFWKEDNGYGIPQFSQRLRRQDMEPQYFENGSIYVIRRQTVERGDFSLGMGIASRGKNRLYKMGEDHSLDLDSLQDWFVLEQLYRYEQRRQL